MERREKRINNLNFFKEVVKFNIEKINRASMKMMDSR